MVLKRYLMYYAYIGTYFRGVQRQVPRGDRKANACDPSTVQGLLEYAIGRMKPINQPIALLASRTDQGVHALKSAITVDLDFHVEPPIKSMHHFLNRFFDDTDLPIRINEIRWVPWEFNCRKAPLWRRYVYRFAILKPDILPEDKSSKFTLPYPIVEYNRCYFVNDTRFDYEAVSKACEVFVGMQDYIAFLGKPKSTMHAEDLLTYRYMHNVHLERAHPYLPTELNDHFDYYHLIVEGKSFIYNQVRKMVGILLAVGRGELTVDDVQKLFIDPAPESWPAQADRAPACGLYLQDIFYDPKELELPKDIKKEFKELASFTSEQEKQFHMSEELNSAIKEAKEGRVNLV